MIYFDNAATTFFKPPEVIQAAVNTVKYLSVNPGRSAHFMAIKGASAMFHARKTVGDFFGCDDFSRVIFTSGCTESVNLAVFGSNLYGKHVVTTALEHNAVLRPLFELKRRGIISLSVVNPNENGCVTALDVMKALRPSTALVAVVHVSNVTGAVNPVAEIGAVCRKYGVLFLVDAAQSAGHEHVDVKKCNIDMLAVPAHKGLHSLPGAGALILSERVALTPIVFGGTGVDSINLVQSPVFPEGLEAGTRNLPGIVAMARAAGLAKRDFETRKNALSALTHTLTDNLKRIGGVRLYSPENSPSGIVSFNISGMTSEETADILSEKYRICVRSGLHCAPLIHRALGTEQRGIVRASLAFCNTDGEVAAFSQAVEDIAKRKK